MEDGPFKAIRQAIQDLGKYQIRIESLSMPPETLHQCLNSKESFHLLDMKWWGSETPTICGIPFVQKT